MSEHTVEFYEWREKEREERKQRHDMIATHNENTEDEWDWWSYDMPPNTIRPMAMTPIGPEVCGWCLMTNEEDYGDCDASFHVINRGAE